MNIDLNVICRVCLQSDKHFHSVFQEINSISLVSVIRDIANISITEEDHMPRQICEDCAAKLTVASNIRHLIIASDEYLRNYLEVLEDQGSKDDKFSCDTCGKTFRSFSSLRRHTKYHLVERIECPICSRSFSHKSNLKRHIVSHADISRPQCNQCSDSFDTISALYEHIKSHKRDIEASRDDYMMHCELCPERTSSYVAFRNHMREKHNVSGTLRPFICGICSARFTSKQGMFRHVDNIHENNRRNLRNRNKNFLCTACGKNFYTNFHLEVHTRSHTGQRPFRCQFPDCSKAFTQLSGLKMHTYTHTGEKPFGCKVCGKSFNQYGHVREHMMIHSNIRPHVCKICNHSFRVKGNLTAHMLIHSGKKPHICSICGKQFIQSSKLRQHQEKKHRNCDG